MNKKKKLTIAKFIQYVVNKLGINTPYKVITKNKRDESFKTYAYYDPNSGAIYVYTHNRGLADILRSIGHELVHHLQRQKGEIKTVNQDVGGKIEDEANARSGSLIKQFGYDFPDYNIYEN